MSAVKAPSMPSERTMTSFSLLQGIIGDTYERFTVGQEAFNPNSTFWLPDDVSAYMLHAVLTSGNNH